MERDEYILTYCCPLMRALSVKTDVYVLQFGGGAALLGDSSFVAIAQTPPVLPSVYGQDVDHHYQGKDDREKHHLDSDRVMFVDIMAEDGYASAVYWVMNQAGEGGGALADQRVSNKLLVVEGHVFDVWWLLLLWSLLLLLLSYVVCLRYTLFARVF